MEFHFCPEIAFGHAMAKAWPDETIGIIKFSIGGTSILTGKPDWSKQDADRAGQLEVGKLFAEAVLGQADQPPATSSIGN